MSETCVVLANVESWRPLSDGSYEVSGKLNNDTLTKAATTTVNKVVMWLRTSKQKLIGQLSLDNECGDVRIENKTIIATVTDKRALPLVRRGVFQHIVAVVDDVMGSAPLAISLVDRAPQGIMKSASNSVLLYKRLAPLADFVEAAPLLYDREEAKAANLANENYLRRSYGMKPVRTTPKLKKDRASNKEVKATRKAWKKLGGTLGKAY
jgi:hypothetical protein